jgi:thiamine kinase-like enzyme
MHDPTDAAISRALSLPCWRAPRNARPLEGGKTNRNILVEDQGRRFVVRLGQDIPEHGIMRWNELAISRAAHQAGLAPGVHYAEPGVLVLDYIGAEPLIAADLRDPATLVPVVGLIARLHREVTRALRGPVLCFWVFHILRDYAHTLTERGSSHSPMLPTLMDEALRLEEMIGPVTLVLGHNDLLPSNILRGQGRFWLIDWEYAGLTSPLFDLGGLATNSGLDRTQERLMLRTYIGRPPSARLWRSYSAMKCASLLRETMWSMVSEVASDLDVDYAAYTEVNLVAYRAALAQLSQL